MNIKRKLTSLFALPLLLILAIETVMAHCPLCTIGAGAAAGAAMWLGVSKIIVALFIGAFSMSMGMWFARMVKKKYIPLQKTVIISVIFLATLLPLLPIFKTIGPLYLSFIGEYGTTYALDYSLVTGLFGGMIVFISPKLNKKLKNIRGGEGIPFQGILIAFLILLMTAIMIQFNL